MADLMAAIDKYTPEQLAHWKRLRARGMKTGDPRRGDAMVFSGMRTAWIPLEEWQPSANNPTRKKKTAKRKGKKAPRRKGTTVTTMTTTKTTRTVRKTNPSQAYDVYLHGKKIDTVFFSKSAKMNADEVKRSLVDHDGYDDDITVKKARTKKSNTGRKRNPKIERGTKSWYRRNLIMPREAGDNGDVDVFDTLYSWHGGQNSAVYSLASTGDHDYVSASMIDRALNDLRRDLRTAKKVSKKDKEDLRTVIDELSGVLGYPEDHTTKAYTGEDKDSGYDDYGMRVDEVENPPRLPKSGRHKVKRRPKPKKTNPERATSSTANARALAQRLVEGD